MILVIILYCFFIFKIPAIFPLQLLPAGSSVLLPLFVLRHMCQLVGKDFPALLRLRSIGSISLYWFSAFFSQTFIVATASSECFLEL